MLVWRAARNDHVTVYMHAMPPHRGRSWRQAPLGACLVKHDAGIAGCAGAHGLPHLRAGAVAVRCFG